MKIDFFKERLYSAVTVRHSPRLTQESDPQKTGAGVHFSTARQNKFHREEQRA